MTQPAAGKVTSGVMTVGKITHLRAKPGLSEILTRLDSGEKNVTVEFEEFETEAADKVKVLQRMRRSGLAPSAERARTYLASGRAA